MNIILQNETKFTEMELSIEKLLALMFPLPQIQISTFFFSLGWECLV